MKRTVALLLIFATLASLLTGCGVKAEKIDFDKAYYKIRTTSDEKSLGVEKEIDEDELPALEMYESVLKDAIKNMPATAYVLQLTNAQWVDEYDARVYLDNALAKDNWIVDISDFTLGGIWGVRTDDGSYMTDMLMLYVNVEDETDANAPVVYVYGYRLGLEMYSMSFKIDKKSMTVTDSTFKVGTYNRELAYSGPQVLNAETEGKARTMYFSGSLNKTGFLEYPVLAPIDMNLKITGKPVDGDAFGGFAGGFQGTVTLDGQTFALTLDADGMEIPTGLLEDPSDYYVAFSESAITSIQDKTSYRNVYFIRVDFKEIIGLYNKYADQVVCTWFQLARVEKSTYSDNIKENNQKLAALYSDIIVDAYGSRMEYNNMLAVVYNMFIGVEQRYLKKHLDISKVSGDIVDYNKVIFDTSISSTSLDESYFIPDSRTVVERLYQYDGTTAIVAVDFSPLSSDSGYGGLYQGVYENGKWQLTVLKDKRIGT
jgi:hypothetical protein